MNRAHNSKEAEASLRLATQYFDNISIDSYYGMPDMSAERWEENIGQRPYRLKSRIFPVML